MHYIPTILENIHTFWDLISTFILIFGVLKVLVFHLVQPQVVKRTFDTNIIPSQLNRQYHFVEKVIGDSMFVWNIEVIYRNMQEILIWTKN